ncbi:hypothetical protein vBValMR10Z_10 [Vibrio phage vB_ValM_R10Z]|nr:hypothetical protein vBValMR10Z_10 [Vibrio phage vB_ValM_R10Z]
MKAYRINTSIEDLAIEKHDVFVQSPFDSEQFVMARDPSRAPLCHALILNFKHLYNEIDVTEEEIPELIEHWQKQYQTNIESLNMFRQALVEQMTTITHQINDVDHTIKKLNEKLRG